MRPYLKKSFTKIGLVEWLKVKALSSSPHTTKKKKAYRALKFLAVHLLGVLSLDTPLSRATSSTASLFIPC
jgi:hypothetical protein